MTPETNTEISDRHNDEAISIAVISTQITGLKELMLEKFCKQDVVLANIKEQTTKTNGHVADNISKIQELDGWKNRIIGGLIISNIFIVPVLLWLIFQPKV